MSTATVVILGGTGWLGAQISKAFLTEYRKQFPAVRITTRDTSSAKASELAKLGAELVAYSTPLEEILAGADVVVNALSRTPAEEKKKVIATVAASNAKVYFLSEYGLDHVALGAPWNEHPEWASKRELAASVRASFKGKTIALSTGGFLEILASPFAAAMGYDIANNTYTAIGSSSTRTAFTAQVDIARVIAQLSVLALDPATASKVPDSVHIAGNNVSADDVADTVARVRGVPRGKVEVADLEALEKSLLEASPEERAQRFFDYFKVAVGLNAADGSVNDNELVNPGQTLWKWKIVEDVVRETA